MTHDEVVELGYRLVAYIEHYSRSWLPAYIERIDASGRMHMIAIRENKPEPEYRRDDITTQSAYGTPESLLAVLRQGDECTSAQDRVVYLERFSERDRTLEAGDNLAEAAFEAMGANVSFPIRAHLRLALNRWEDSRPRKAKCATEVTGAS